MPPRVPAASCANTRRVSASGVASARAVGYESDVGSPSTPEDESGHELGDAPECVDHGEAHDGAPAARYDDEAVEAAASLFRALGDVARLRTMELLVDRELCVSEIAAASGELISTVSHRMRLLRAEGLVSRRRSGRHIYYALRDHHVYDLVRNALEHVSHDHE